MDNLETELFELEGGLTAAFLQGVTGAEVRALPKRRLDHSRHGPGPRKALIKSVANRSNGLP